MDDNVNNTVSNNDRIANDSNVADDYWILSNLTSNINNTPATSGGGVSRTNKRVVTVASAESRLRLLSNLAGDINNKSAGSVGGSSSSSRLPSVSNVAGKVLGATGTVPTNRNMSSGNGDVASSTNTPQKEDIIILKIKDIVLDDRNNVSHIGLYPIKRITLNNVRFFMSANSIKLNSKTKNVTWWKGLLTQKLNTIGVRARCYQRTLGQSRPLLQLTTLSLE